MTSVYDSDGKQVACTVILAEPNVVTQIKTVETDQYNAVQLGFGERKEKHTTKPLLGHFKKAGTTPKRKLVEFRDFSIPVKLGDTISITDVFNEGDTIHVVGTSKGKGFQGVVKRHGFRGVGDATHGQHNRQRHPGSIGASAFPSRVVKGLRMAGRMGNQRVKIRNLKIVKILPEQHILLVKGAVPGHKGAFVILQKEEG